MDTFRLCTTPQIFIETIEETFSKGRRLRFGCPERRRCQATRLSLEKTENMRTDMCRQIGPCFVLNSQSFTTKTLKQCVLDLSEAMRRVQISTCGEKTVQKGVYCSSAKTRESQSYHSLLLSIVSPILNTPKPLQHQHPKTGTGHDHLSRMMLRAADHVTSGSILVNTIGTMLFPSEGKVRWLLKLR